MIRERAYNGIPGLPMLLLFIAADAGLLWMLVMNIRSESAPEIVVAAIGIALSTFLAAGLFALAVAMVTVFGHALKVARANPIHALRYE